MKKLLPLLILILTFAFTAFGQDFEYGKSSELKGLNKVWISTGTDGANGSRIAQAISKQLPNVEIVSTEGEAEILIVFEGRMEARSYGSTSAGSGFVAIKGKNPKTPRILISYEGAKSTYFEGKPATKFANNFIKEYKKANSLK